MAALIYTTGRVVKIPSKILYLTNLTISIFITLYIIGYGIFWSKGYQSISPVESVVVTKVKGVLKTSFSEKELNVPNPSLYNRVWDASDIVIPSHGEESGGFFILTDLIITPNQTRGKCAESLRVGGSVCKTDGNCVAGKKLGNGVMTGKCIQYPYDAKIKTCEVEAWCPTEQDKPPLTGKALLEGTKDFTVLVKNSVNFPMFGHNYKTRNIVSSAIKPYLQSCVHDSNNPNCPTFKLGNVVAEAKQDYTKVARTGAVFAIRIEWMCDFDFKSVSKCLPKYYFDRLDNPEAHLSPGFNFLSTTYHEENRRTLTRCYGLKFVIDVDGEGRKFDPVKLILAIGASVGLFALASTICDFLLGILCTLAGRFDWPCLSGYTAAMKYDMTFLKDQVNDKRDANIELDEVQVLKQK